MRKYRRVNEDVLPDEVYNKAWENAKRTYVVTARGAAPYHYEINTEYGIYAKVPNDMGFLAHWFLDTRSKDTVEEMEELASKYIRKYNCKKVSVQEYKKLIDGGVNESYKRRNRGVLKERKHIAHDMLADGDWVEYSIIVFPDANKMGFPAQNRRGEDIAFDTIREAQRYADENFPDAECIVVREEKSRVSGPKVKRANGKWGKIDGFYSDNDDADLTESYKRRIREGSSYAIGDEMFKLNGINLKDWYTSEYPDDELGYELNDDVDLRRCLSSLGREPDIYDVMGVRDSLIRERVFAKMADVLGVDYDVIYRKWLDY